MTKRFAWAFAAVTVLLISACGEDAGPIASGTADTSADTMGPGGDPDEVDAQDTGGEVDDTAGTDAADVPDDSGPPESGRVEVELSEFTAGAPDEGDQVSVFQVDDVDQLVGGVSAQGLLGDYVIENGRSRFVIEGIDRAMSPCPYGGNVIDLDIVREDGEQGEDVLGEVCLLINGGSTLVPETVEILADGTDGEAGVLAVTGQLDLNDFLNLRAMASGYIGNIDLDLALDPDRILPATVTIYYILRPGDVGLHVISSIRNDGEEREFAGMFHIMRPAGDGGIFNPLSTTGGFGFTSLGADNLAAEEMPFIGYQSPRSTFAYVPDPNPALRASLPIGGGYFGVAGTIVTLLGNDNLFGAVLAPLSNLPRTQGIVDLEPGESEYRSHWMIPGGPALSDVVDPAWDILGVDTETLSGVVRDSAGDPAEGVRVVAVDDRGRGFNQALSDAEGAFAMALPEGEYTLLARGDGRVGALDDPVEPGDDSVEVTVLRAAALTVSASTPDGDPTPARVDVRCEGECGHAISPQEDDVLRDRLPRGYQRIDYIGADGELTLHMEPGTYRVVVSRGTEWTYWPQDSASSGGHLVTLEEGAELDLEAEIAHVVDSSGAQSGDFHIHAISSTDSPILNELRVLNFASEGVDVMISTDHDFIADFAPAIASLGLEAEVTSVVGAEITTSDYGHFNAFPLLYDPAQRTGGALDWGNGPGFTLLPRELYEWVHDHDGEQVVQINHAGSTVGSLQADVLLGTSGADPATLRMPEQTGMTIPGDTGLWSDDFTAMEVMNGHGSGGFWQSFRWWLLMVGRGHQITGTAVTDTHKLLGDLGGSPRSFVFVSDDHDTPSTFDEAEFVASVNAGRLVGSNGPFFRATLVNEDDAEAGLGDTLTSSTGALTARIEIDVPEWMSVDTIDVYSNVTEDLHSDPGTGIGSRLEPTSTTPFELVDDDLVVAGQGTLTHRHYVKTVEVPVEVTEDAYVVFIVRSNGGGATLAPVIPNSGVRPMAWSNPIFVDMDGNGYDTFPLIPLRDSLIETREAEGAEQDLHEHRHAPVMERLRLNPRLIGEIADHARCGH